MNFYYITMNYLLLMDKSTFMIKLHPESTILLAWQPCDTEELIEKITSILSEAELIFARIDRNYLKYIKYFDIPIYEIILNYVLTCDDFEPIIDYVLPYLVRTTHFVVFGSSLKLGQPFEDFIALLKERNIGLILNSG